MFTPWSYEIDAEDLPPLVSVQDFGTMTGGKYTNATLVETALDAASHAIRNACGWHISPSASCTALLTASGNLAKLPAGYVSSVEKVSTREPRSTEWHELTVPDEAEWRHDGLMRSDKFSDAWDGIEAEYTAGYESAAIPDLSFAVVGIAEGVLSLPKGVASESADGVAVTYLSQAQSVANAMTDSFKAQLEPYRLVSSHAV